MHHAEEFCRTMRLKLRPEGRARLRPGLETAAFFAELRGAGLLADARRVLAHALPPRRALWWGCLCAWEAYRPEPPADVLGILSALTSYVQQPDDGQRRALRVMGVAAGMSTLAGHLALAAFCSTGSLSKPGLPVVSPAPFVTGRLVGVAVYLASVRREPARYRARLAQFLEVGLEVARGDALWPEPIVEAVVPERRDPARPLAALAGSTF